MGCASRKKRWLAVVRPVMLAVVASLSTNVFSRPVPQLDFKSKRIAVVQQTFKGDLEVVEFGIIGRCDNNIALDFVEGRVRRHVCAVVGLRYIEDDVHDGLAALYQVPHLEIERGSRLAHGSHSDHKDCTEGGERGAEEEEMMQLCGWLLLGVGVNYGGRVVAPICGGTIVAQAWTIRIRGFRSELS